MIAGRRRLVVASLVVCLGAGSVAAGVASVVGTASAQARYEDLARGTATTEAVTDAPAIDWDELERQNPDICAWLSVGGTSIDYPVCKRDQSYYLTHDVWGQESSVGCPFMDELCEVDSPSVLVYAHHITGTTAMFSELSATTTQGGFDDILGDCRALWLTRGRACRLRPLCTIVVDKSDQDIQRKRFACAQDVRLWLQDQLGRASARSAEAQTLVEGATRCVSCVTCASDISGQRERAVVLFVDGP